MKRSRRTAKVLLAVALAGVAVAVTTGAQAHKLANIQVCVLLPDTKSSVRWVQFDAPDFAKALKAAKVTYSITNALNDPQKMVSQADSCLSRGAKVAIVTDIAQGTSIAIEKKFAKAGGSSIDYDRQVVGGIAKVYVSFDGQAVGAAQARGVVIALSGQDATVQGVQNIISGWQTMTVYKYVPLEANAAAKAAVALLKHKKVPGVNGFRKNGSKKEPTVQIPVISITKANYTRLFKDKFLKKSDVCVGEFKQFCK